MTDKTTTDNMLGISVPERWKTYPRFTTILSLAFIGFLIFSFFSGLTLQFYASFLFLFYSLIGRMWISVIVLGIFQTLILIPFRLVNLMKSANIADFKDTLKQKERESEQYILLKRKIKGGSRVALFYSVNFVVQTVSYFSLGRLFLTDFYNQPLDPDLLYNFVPYPNYPIEDVIFKIPYPWFEATMDLGMKAVYIAWGLGLVIYATAWVVRMLQRRRKMKKQPTAQLKRVQQFLAFTSGSFILYLGAAWWLLRHFPVDWRIFIFSGNITRPHPPFNRVTAIVTFLTILWVNLPKIQKKVQLAKEAELPKEVVSETQKRLFKEVLQLATLVGLGAYFITNQIPSAFELSIFTLEVIFLLMPLTLDRLVLSRVNGKEEGAEEKEKVETQTPLAIEEAQES